jgi:predicted Rossmann fold nucleotide-binding protein DprA/Smf involved in DNA uptake
VITTVPAGDAGYPARLRDRLGADAPPELHVAGPLTLAGGPLLGVVGSRRADTAITLLAMRIGVAAVRHGWGVVSGGAGGVDEAAMRGALVAGGSVVGFVADPLRPMTKKPPFGDALAEGRLCLASPYGPDEPYTPERAHARNKLVYALARVTLVVTTEEGGSSTWLGAVEALEHGYGEVAVWTGRGAWPGNGALAPLGARPVDAFAQLWSG